MSSNELEDAVQKDVTLFAIKPVIVFNWFAEDKSLPRYDWIIHEEYIYKKLFKQRPIQELEETVNVCIAAGFIPEERPHLFRGDFHELFLRIDSFDNVKPDSLTHKYGHEYHDDNQIVDAFGYNSNFVTLYEVVVGHDSTISVHHNLYRSEPYDVLQSRFDFERDKGLTVFLEPSRDMPVYRIESTSHPHLIQSSYIRRRNINLSFIYPNGDGTVAYNGRRII